MGQTICYDTRRPEVMEIAKSTLASRAATPLANKWAHSIPSG